MLKIRVVKTGSSAKAVQALRYYNNKRIIVKHFGSAHSEEALEELLLFAKEWIKEYSNQLSIFPDKSPSSILHINHCSFLGVYYTFFCEAIISLQQQIGIANLGRQLLNDLVIMRLFEPASKLRSI